MKFLRLFLKLFIIISLPFSLFFSMSFATANNRYTNAQGQGAWNSGRGSPAVEVFIKGAFVYAKVMAVSTSNNSLDLPGIKLKRINSNLLNEYTEQFINFQDFNQDGMLDIGVLKSVGYGGANRCYSVFEYLPNFYSFSSHLSKTVCFN